MRPLSFLFAAAVALGVGPIALGQRGGQSIGIDSVVLDTGATATKMLGAARDLMAARQWGDAIDLVRQIADQHGDRLVAISPRRFVSVQTYCDILLSSLPEEGLRVYRTRTDPQARRWFEAAQAGRDVEGLRKVIGKAFLSSYGDDALLLLGQLAWEQGNLAQARSYWEQLLPLAKAPEPGELPPALRYPAGQVDVAAIRARLVLCTVMQGDAARAVRELAAFREEYPQATGRVAGRTGNLVEILEAEATRAGPQPTTESQVWTFAGNPQRNAVQPEEVDVGSIQWTAPLTPVRLERPERGPAQQEVLACYPAVWGNVVVYADETNIYARELLGAPGGRAPWGGDVSLCKLAPTPGPFDRAGRRLGYPRFSVSIDRGRVYAHLGSSTTRRGLSAPPSSIVCIDLNRQGDPLWERKAIEIEGGGWNFSGGPLAAAGRVYVALRRTEPQLQLNVACLDGDSGRILWNRSVCVGHQAFGPELEETHHQLLTLDDRRLYCCTNLGVVASLSAQDGTLRWVASYPRAEIETATAFNNRQVHGPNPCLYRDGTIYAAPTDSDRVLAYEAETGLVRWDRELKQNAHQLVGVSEGKLVVAGDLLWGLDSENGEVAWRAGRIDPEAATRGRAMIGGGCVYWPRREEIVLVDAATGQVRREIPLTRQHGLPAGGGNITLANGFLLLAQAERLVAFSEYGGLRKQRQNQLTGHPRDAWAQFELGLLAEAMQEPETALAAYARARALADRGGRRDHLPAGRAAERQVRLLMRLGKEAEEAMDWELAANRFTAAADAAEVPRNAIEARIALARLHERQGVPAAAVQEWQRVCEIEPGVPDARDSLGLRVERKLARAEIERLIALHGRTVYRSLEQAAEKALTEALRQRDFEKIAALIARYPNSLYAATAAQQLAGWQRLADELYAADRTYKDVLNGPLRDVAGPWALVGLARNAELRQRWRSALGWWQQLYDRYASAIVEIDGMRGKVAELVADRIDRVRRKMGVGSEAPAPLVRRWERERPAGSVVFVPERRPGDDEPGFVLIGGATIACCDSADGSERWRIALPQQPAWAGFIADLLVLGSTGSATGIAPADGRVLWHHSFEAATAREGAAGAFRLAGERLVCLVGDSEVWSLFPETGEPAWCYRPKEGRVQPHCACGNERIVLQLLAPDRWQVLDAREGMLLGEGAGPAETWRDDPVWLASERWVGLLDGRRPPQVADLLQPRVQATYAGPMSVVNDLPGLIAGEATAIAVIDGTTLARFDLASGKPLWSRRAGAVPVENSRRAACLDAERLYVAAGGVLRCLALDGGDMLWERYLGPAGGWRVERVGPWVAASPVAAKGSVSVLLCDPASGELVERLNVFESADGGEPGNGNGNGPSAVRFHAGVDQALLVTERRLVGFRSQPSRSAASPP